MGNVNKGETLFIPVEVGSGAFLGECLISFETVDGPISGFISSDQVKDSSGTKVVPAKVLEIDSSGFTVRLHGSFFTTTGLAYISKESKFERAA